MQSLQSILKEFLNIESVTVAALISSDGFFIDGVSNQKEIDLEEMAIAASMGYGLGKKLGENMKGGELIQCMLEYDEKAIVIAKIPDSDAILFIVGEKGANLGAIRFYIKKLAPAFNTVFELKS